MDFNKDNVQKIYLGNNLIYTIQEEPSVPNLRGKFTDDSTSSDWWYCANGSSSNKVDISKYVDPITKEFKVDLGENNNTLEVLFFGNNALERIDEVPLGDVATSCSSIFNGCSSLQSVSLPQFTGEKVTNCLNMFSSCSALQSVSMPQFTGENVTIYSSMFYKCLALQSIFINFTIGENTTVMSMFSNYTNYFSDFTTIQTTGGLKICNAIKFEDCHSLTNDSVMVIINSLEDRNEKTTKTLTLYQTQYDELTPEQLAVATNKNWTVARI